MSRSTAFSAKQQANLYEFLYERYERLNSDAVAFERAPTLARMDGGGIMRSKLPLEYQAEVHRWTSTLHPFLKLQILKSNVLRKLVLIAYYCKNS
jgi:hypothetical protein